jgi:hypothetical protein
MPPRHQHTKETLSIDEIQMKFSLFALFAAFNALLITPQILTLVSNIVEKYTSISFDTVPLEDKIKFSIYEFSTALLAQQNINGQEPVLSGDIIFTAARDYFVDSPLVIDRTDFEDALISHVVNFAYYVMRTKPN